MKKSSLISAGVLVFIIGIFLAPLRSGQVPKNLIPASPSTTKVAVIDMQQVFDTFMQGRYGALVTKAREPYLDKLTKLQTEIELLETAKLDTATGRDRRNRIDREILGLKKSLADIDRPAKDLLEFIHIELWNRAERAIKANAEGYGFQLVLGYRKPNDSAPVRYSSSVISKESILNNTIDEGKITPLFIHPGSANITHAVIVTMKNSVDYQFEREIEKKKYRPTPKPALDSAQKVR